MAVYPVRRDVPWDLDGDQAVVEVPRRGGRLVRWFRRLLRAPPSRQLRLDETGTRAWLLADGERTREEIAGELVDEGGTQADALARLDRFLAHLARRGVLELREDPGAASDPRRGFPDHRSATCDCGTSIHLPATGRRMRYRCPGCGARRWSDG